jgi:tRNA pseudouridine55 synthase
VVVDKPQGWTSHDVVAAARRWFGTRRIGHLGTLDPLATGVLPLAVRNATKLVPFLADDDKRYEGTIALGARTDTLDADGEVVDRFEGALPGRDEVASALQKFVGEIEQIPPMYSAVKRGGVPLHRLAREGKEVEREPKRVRIDRIQLLSCEGDAVQIDVECSSGTYVRTLADDTGTLLGCGAHLRDLRRTRSGPFRIEHAVETPILANEATAGQIEARIIAPVEVLGLPVVDLGFEDARRVTNGGEVGSPERHPVGQRVAAMAPSGDLLAVMEAIPGRLRPLRVFPPDGALAGDR